MLTYNFTYVITGQTKNMYFNPPPKKKKYSQNYGYIASKYTFSYLYLNFILNQMSRLCLSLVSYLMSK